MTAGKRIASTVACVVATCTVASAGASALVARSPGQKDSGKIYAAITHAVGVHLLEFAAGAGQDKLFGSVALTLTIIPHQLNATTGRILAKPAVLYTSGGSLSGKLTGIITLTPAGVETFTDGKVSLTHGSGLLKGHQLVGTFSGGGSRTTGQVILRYRATYS